MLKGKVDMNNMNHPHPLLGSPDMTKQEEWTANELNKYEASAAVYAINVKPVPISETTTIPLSSDGNYLP